MIDPKALAEEISTDPAKLGYADAVKTGSDQGIADALNDPAGPGGGTVSLPTLTRDEFLTAILPAAIVIAEKDLATQSKWDRLIRLACAADVVNLATVGGLFLLAEADGLLTPEQVAVIGKRTGSRAEVLWGAGATVSHGDVAFALRGNQ